jgi:hypothetical protein
MEVKVFGVRVGDRYGPEYEDYLKSKIPNIEFLNEEKEGFIKQWNKIHFFNLDYNEPIVVIDIDILLENNYMEMINYPCEEGEFISLHSWWEGQDETKSCFINGGFYKFWPKSTKYIYNEFKENKLHWEQYFIKNGFKKGPVNGEENFVELMVKKRLKLKVVPWDWCIRMDSTYQHDKNWLLDLNTRYPGEWAYMGGDFNENIKFVHYTKEGNSPTHKKGTN